MYIDEHAYMQRAMIVLEDHGPRDTTFSYDHPYFGQLFLAGIFRIIAYPDALISSITRGDIHSIEILFLVPRVLIGMLAVVDTLLVYKISERRFSRSVAFIASILFAVMPMTWLLRRILLDNILMPFLLSSILFAVYYNSNNNTNTRKSFSKSSSNSKQIITILLSGIFLGLAIFTKIPAFTMIPLVGFLLFYRGVGNNNNNHDSSSSSISDHLLSVFHFNKKNINILGLWLIPVIMIPSIWPIHAFSVGEFNAWLNGIYYQTHRNLSKEFSTGAPLGIGSVFDEIALLFWIDPVLLILGFAGLVFAAIKRDFLLLLWFVPFLLFLYLEGFVQYFYLVPILPAFCIAAAKLIEYISKKIANKYLRHKKDIVNQKSFPFIIISGIATFGLANTAILITTNVNFSYFQTQAFVSRYISATGASSNIYPDGYKNDLTVISDFPYTWIPNHVLHQGQYKRYWMIDPVRTEKVLLMLQDDYLDDFLTNTFLLGNENIRGNAIYNDTFPIAVFKSNLGEQDVHKKINIYPYNSIRLSPPLLQKVELRTNIISLNSSGFVFHINRNGPKVTQANGTIQITIPTSQSGILPSSWDDPSGNCKHIFKCTFNSTATGWNGNGSFQISTNTTSKNTWSWIYGDELAVNASQKYELVTHMKLSEFVIGSHIAIQGYNRTKGWYQINQCPSGTDGPLEWHEYSCKITIPANIDKIRPILNAGWSSQAGKEAVTWFDSIYFSSILPSGWEDVYRNCDHVFKCTSNSITGRIGNTSLQISTNTTSKNTWSWIRGKEIGVNPGEQYLFTTHMKLNNFASGSHIAIEAYNETSKKWHQLYIQCPEGKNGPLEWHEYSCKITIPANIDKIRPILNAGWSSQAGKEAVTWFDSIYLTNISQNKIYNINLIASNLISNPHFVFSDDDNYARFISLCKLRGDFDVQMRYGLLNWPRFNGVGLGIIAQESTSSNTTHNNRVMSVERISLDPKINSSYPSEVYATHFNDGVHLINATRMANYTDDIPVTTTKGDTSGKLRMVRSGFTIEGYYYKSGAWIPIHSSTVISPSDVNIILQTGTKDLAHKPTEMAFLSYVVRKGNTVDCQTK